MTETKTQELNEILKVLYDLEARVKNFEVLPNWEARVKRDLLHHLRLASLDVGDFLYSESEDEIETETVPFEEWLGVDQKADFSEG